MSDEWTVEIVCTDRGQHKRTWMTRFIYEDGAWRSIIIGSRTPKHDMFGPPDADAAPGDVTSREAYGFACSRCTRWPKLGQTKWIALMDAARLSEIDQFDVSYLD